jgi:tetratricopeptide (TPR) repeat protein
MWWIAALALTAVSALGAEDRFYGDMLQRGVSDALRGANDRAITELRIAAFGSIDSLPEYQTAEIYLATACERLGRHDEARTAAQKAIQAERLSPTYGTLTIDATIRAAFEKLLPQLVGADRFADVAAFSRLTRSAPAASPTGKTPPRPAPVQATRPTQPVAPKPQPQPAPAPAQQQAVAATTKPGPGVATATPQTSAATTPTPKPQPVVPTPPPQPTPSIVVDPVAAPPPSPSRPPVNSTMAPKTDPVTTPTPQPRPATALPPPPTATSPAPAPQTMSPLAAAAKHPPSQYGVDVTGRIAEAQRLLNEGKMIAARQAFSRIAQTSDAPRSALLDAAKGLSETNAWNDSSLLYAKLFPLKRGEEAHYFYEAINRYELGEMNKARELLARALPYLPNTREVALYRGKIEGTTQ